MTVELPSFVSNSFLREVFAKNFSFNESLEIKSFWGEWATKKGDNYASEMYRLHVDYEIDGVNLYKPVLLKVIKIQSEDFEVQFRFVLLADAVWGNPEDCHGEE
jgi:hypothetical protein